MTKRMRLLEELMLIEKKLPGVEHKTYDVHRYT